MTVAVAGCVAQAEGEEIMRRAPAVDLVVGPQSYHRLPALLAARRRERGKVDRHRVSGRGQVRSPCAAEPRGDPRRAASPPSSPCRRAATSSAPSASCPTRAAPKSRGRSQASSPRSSGSPPPACARSRCIGQNVNAYHGEGPDGRRWTLGRLLHASPQSPASRRLRYTTSHPRDMDDELIAAHRDLPQR